MKGPLQSKKALVDRRLASFNPAAAAADAGTAAPAPAPPVLGAITAGLPSVPPALTRAAEGATAGAGGGKLHLELRVLQERLTTMEVAHAEKVRSMAAEHADMAKSFKAHIEQQQTENARVRAELRLEPSADAPATATKQGADLPAGAPALAKLLGGDAVEKLLHSAGVLENLEDANWNFVRGASVALDRLRPRR